MRRRKYGSKTAKKKSSRGRTTNPWIRHVKAYQRAHPRLTYAEAMVKARASYR